MGFFDDDQDDIISERSFVSTSSTRSKRIKKKSKNLARPYTLEEIYEQRSVFDATVLNPPTTEIVLTPRSASVVLEMGINPELLKERTFESFWQEGIDAEVHKFRYDAYEKRRQIIMKNCREERSRQDKIEENKLAMKAKVASSKSMIGGGDEELTPEQILEQQAEANSTLLMIEQKRMEKMKLRQAKELNKMIDFEVNQVKIRQEMEKRIKASERKAQIREKAERKRLKKIAEDRRARDIKKKTMEDVEEAISQQKTKILMDRERELKRARDEAEVERRREAEQREIVKQQEMAKKKAELKAYFDDHQKNLREKAMAIKGHDEAKKKAMFRIAKEKARETQAKNEAAQQRIAHNVQAAADHMEQRKREFLERQRRSEEIRREKQDREDYMRMVKAESNSLEEERRRYKHMKQREDERQKSLMLQERAMIEDINVERVKQERARAHQLKIERTKVDNLIKEEVVQRAKKVADFKRSATLKKVEESERRIANMNAQREKLKEDRRLAAVKTRLQREQIGVVMEDVRGNATKADKLVKVALSGNVSLENLIAPPRDSNVAKIKAKAKKKKAKATAHMSRLLRESQSAAEQYRTLPSFETKLMDEKAAMYISPFEMPYDVGIGNSMEAHLQEKQKEAADAMAMSGITL